MNAFHDFIERWGALASGIVLLALPLALVLLALEDFLRRRALANALRRGAPRASACPRCGEPLLEREGLMTDIDLSERLLDPATKCTFPAGDPIAVQHASMNVPACRHE